MNTQETDEERQARGNRIALTIGTIIIIIMLVLAKIFLM